MTQGAVAQQVRGLEAALQVKLFKRLPRGLALTEEGRRYLAPMQRAFQLIAEATDELRPQQAILTISVTPTFASKWLVPRLGLFLDANPSLDVRVVAGEGLANFQSDGVDIAVRQGKPPFGPGLTWDLLFPFDVYPVCALELQSGSDPIEKPEDLVRHVLLHDAHGLWPLFLERTCGEKSLPVARALHFSQTALALDAALAGQGVALASAPLVEDDLASGRLCRPLQVTVQSDMGFFIVAPRKPRHPQRVSLIRDWLLTQGGPAERPLKS